uniref:Uncharacterized protein n=1 Tax=Ciona savignyi TaxID=51511 RepID=H2YVW5_CIOSA
MNTRSHWSTCSFDVELVTKNEFGATSLYSYYEAKVIPKAPNAVLSECHYMGDKNSVEMEVTILVTRPVHFLVEYQVEVVYTNDTVVEIDHLLEQQKDIPNSVFFDEWKKFPVIAFKHRRETENLDFWKNAVVYQQSYYQGENCYLQNAQPNKTVAIR